MRTSARSCALAAAMNLPRSSAVVKFLRFPSNSEKFVDHLFTITEDQGAVKHGNSGRVGFPN